MAASVNTQTPGSPVRSVAVIGAGASGAIALAALRDEGVFDVIRVFERQTGVGGVWRYESKPVVHTVLSGETEKTLDPPLEIPETLPAVTVASSQERWTETPTYSHLLTNIPAFAMSFSDSPLDKAFKDTGAPQPRPWVASETRDPAEMATDYKNYFGPYTAVQNYLEDYFKSGRADDIQLGVTVEDVAKDEATGKWRLVLRRPVVGRKGEALNQWWEEKFDGVVVANGRYYIPNIPEVPGLANFQKAFPGVVEHSKFYRTPEPYTGLKVLVVGNRPSGFDIIRHILPLTGQPVYQSKRSEYGYEPATAPEGVIWKPQILRYEVDPNTNTGRVVFNDGTVEDGFDKIIYTTGYRYSLPFLQRQYPDISTGTRIVGTYLHTFYRGNPGDPPLCFVGSIIDGVSFRGFEFQAIASARYLAGKFKLPSHEEMKAWEYARFSERGDNRVFHSVGMYSAKEFWVKLVELCGNPGPGEKGRPFPEQDERFWKMFEEIYHWRVRDCLNPLL